MKCRLLVFFFLFWGFGFLHSFCLQSNKSTPPPLHLHPSKTKEYPNKLPLFPIPGVTNLKYNNTTIPHPYIT